MKAGHVSEKMRQALDAVRAGMSVTVACTHAAVSTRGLRLAMDKEGMPKLKPGRPRGSKATETAVAKRMFGGVTEADVRRIVREEVAAYMVGTHRPAAACTRGQACVGAAADSVGRRTKHLPADDTEGVIE